MGDETAAPAEPFVKGIKTPIQLHYTVNAGRNQSRFLSALMERRIIGMRCPDTGKIYCPPQGVSPICGKPFIEEVEVAHVGTVTTFTVVHIPFEGQQLEPPWCTGWILLDGSDLPLLHVIKAKAEDVRMGLRVRAVWGDPIPSLNAIRWFEPTGEPDAEYDTYKEHL